MLQQRELQGVTVLFGHLPFCHTMKPFTEITLPQQRGHLSFPQNRPQFRERSRSVSAVSPDDGCDMDKGVTEPRRHGDRPRLRQTDVLLHGPLASHRVTTSLDVRNVAEHQPQVWDETLGRKEEEESVLSP